jgi:hypothetical protein
MSTEHQGLSADEIALLESDELDGEGLPKDDAPPPGDGDDDTDPPAATPAPAPAAKKEEEDDGDPDDADEAAAAAAAAVAAAAPAAPAPAPAATSSTPAPAPAADAIEQPEEPQYKVIDAGEIKKQLEALEAKEGEAHKKLMDGDIDEAEYAKVKREVRAEEHKLIVQQTLHEANVQAEQKANNAAIHALMKTAKTANEIDYVADAKAQRQFDQALELLANDPDNVKKTFPQLLSEAHRTVLALRGITPKAAATPAPGPAPAPAPKPSRSVDKALLPPTLSRVPPAADPSIAGNEFAHLANLSGSDHEKAVAKLTPEQLERYLD